MCTYVSENLVNERLVVYEDSWKEKQSWCFPNGRANTIDWYNRSIDFYSFSVSFSSLVFSISIVPMYCASDCNWTRRILNVIILFFALYIISLFHFIFTINFILFYFIVAFSSNSRIIIIQIFMVKHYALNIWLSWRPRTMSPMIIIIIIIGYIRGRETRRLSF